ncbi:hypothetical protein B0H17DRAFT_1147277 [Mycena rosella]|uniref:Uncharacterized protein n=1 Tax=Mycena rosella TaxID=1033263 RepID=A0AAD7CLX9_MYCRO|nr:hypothetical protein B0H17DRAFT_1147277 [Mycena rosella]
MSLVDAYLHISGGTFNQIAGNHNQYNVAGLIRAPPVAELLEMLRRIDQDSFWIRLGELDKRGLIEWLQASLFADIQFGDEAGPLIAVLETYVPDDSYWVRQLWKYAPFLPYLKFGGEPRAKKNRVVRLGRNTGLATRRILLEPKESRRCNSRREESNHRSSPYSRRGILVEAWRSAEHYLNRKKMRMLGELHAVGRNRTSDSRTLIVLLGNRDGRPPWSTTA